MADTSRNPLIDDRTIQFLLYEVLDVEALCARQPFTEHSRDTFEMLLASTRRLAREALYPAYRPMDQEPPELVDGADRIDLGPEIAVLQHAARAGAA